MLSRMVPKSSPKTFAVLSSVHRNVKMDNVVWHPWYISCLWHQWISTVTVSLGFYCLEKSTVKIHRVCDIKHSNPKNFTVFTVRIRTRGNDISALYLHPTSAVLIICRNILLGSVCLSHKMWNRWEIEINTNKWAWSVFWVFVCPASQDLSVPSWASTFGFGCFCLRKPQEKET